MLRKKEKFSQLLECERSYEASAGGGKVRVGLRGTFKPPTVPPSNTPTCIAVNLRFAAKSSKSKATSL